MSTEPVVLKTEALLLVQSGKGVGGPTELVSVEGTQTLKNKTLVAPTLTGPILSNAEGTNQVEIPSNASGDVVCTTNAASLSNKTLDATCSLNGSSIANPKITGPTEPTRLLEPTESFTVASANAPAIVFVKMGDICSLYFNLKVVNAIAAGDMIQFTTGLVPSVYGAIGTTICVGASSTKRSIATVVSMSGLKFVFDDAVAAGSFIYGTVTWNEHLYK